MPPELPATVARVHYEKTPAKWKPCDNTFIPTPLASASVSILYPEMADALINGNPSHVSREGERVEWITNQEMCNKSEGAG